MEHLTPAASQETVVLAESPVTESNPVSSPTLPAFEFSSSGRPRKPPTITPRSFTRFFTPKSSILKGRSGASRQVLRDITASGHNQQRDRSAKKVTSGIASGKHGQTSSMSGSKRRRTLPPSPRLTPDFSSPLKMASWSPNCRSRDVSEDDDSDNGHAQSLDQHNLVAASIKSVEVSKRWPKDVISRSRRTAELERGLQQEICGRVQKSTGNHPCPNSDWQHGIHNELSKFYTGPGDRYYNRHVELPLERSIPFCSRACNTNTLVAIADEDGGIRLLESASGPTDDFSTPFLKFRPHTNAILDIDFSMDDMLLATASGDQTAKVIDMPSQEAIYTMAGHISSVKQVRFQPSNSSVIVTSSRDGSVQIWDLRCRGLKGPVHELKVSLDGTTPRCAPDPEMKWARSVNTIFDAHVMRQNTGDKSVSASGTNTDLPSKSESPGRTGDVSVTALTFLTHGREHLLATGSEADATVKLWDLRTTHNHRRGHAMPLSTTRQPVSHSKYRRFGLTSFTLSGDGARLYTTCRDNTVYAYSTSHLALGHVPELSSANSKPRRSGQQKTGLGPMYGFRHPKFHATTFYIKSAIRTAKDDHTELLAVGSSDGTPVIFPTDERYMQRQLPTRPPSSVRHSNSQLSKSRPPLSPTASGTDLSGRLEDAIPIYRHGTALVRGHELEVTGLNWTVNGELVTVSDDFQVRCWREGYPMDCGSRARHLRKNGEMSGQRWGSGWAEMPGNWGESDDSD